eukprot:Opistho-2@51319
MSHPRAFYEQDNGQTSTGASALFNAIGNSKSLAGGFAGYMMKSMIVASSASVVFGLSTSMLFFGPMAPFAFLGGAGFGFVGGLVHRWNTDVRDAIQASEEFPELIEYHIRNLDPQFFSKQSYADWQAKLRASNIKARGTAITAYYSAAEAITDIRRRREAIIAERYSEMAAKTIVYGGADSD